MHIYILVTKVLRCFFIKILLDLYEVVRTNFSVDF